ncbi:BamA/TamA family outer membrane protein [bacterium]|nr:BamA/TamA family outer membrane protein [bacterium]
MPEDEKLLVKNKIEHSDKSNVDLSDESDYLRQRPNRKLFGFIRFHLWAYQSGAKGVSIGQDTGRIRKFLINIGEPPVVLDTSKARLSAEKLSDYYYSKGYLNNSVTYEVKTRPILKKRAKVTYHVELNDFHRIANVEYLATSKKMDELLMDYVSKSKLVPGQRLDFDNITAERNRLTQLMKDNGFYYFNNSYIDFKVDTTQTSGYAFIRVYIRNDRNLEVHKQQTINKVSVYVDQYGSTDTFQHDSLIIYESNYLINPEVLSRNIHFRPNEVYSSSAVQRTYADLLGIGLFRFVTIRFVPVGGDTSTLLNAEIVLQTNSRHDFIWEPQAITTEQGGGIAVARERNFGLGNNITLKNRNVFGNGESFNLNTGTALETQFKKDQNRFFTNFRQSVSMEFIIPNLVFIDEDKRFKDFTQKNTKFNASYLFDRNVNFTRHVFPFNYVYSFQYNRKSYSITPYRISYNRAAVEQSFIDGLSPEAKSYINQLLTDNLITGSILSMYWSTRYKNNRRYWNIRTNPFETSGNLFSLYYNVFTNQRQINRQILGVKYSQYYRADIDLTYHYIIDQNNALVYRYYAGFGLPYGNTRFLPFERRFFVGGGNSIRAWRPRTIGPGGFTDDQNQISIDKTGEIMLQANVEYRFDIVDERLYGAWFVDGGNIWNFREDPNLPDAEFKLDRFYQEIAINSGIGLRFDFTYLIFRVDWGVAMRDPTYPLGERWVILDFPSNQWITSNSALNIAVGYPF